MIEPIRIGAPAAPSAQNTQQAMQHQAPHPAPAPAQPKGIEADIDALILGGVVERSVEPFTGWKVTMHTLTNEERLQASKYIPNDVQLSAAASQEAVKLPTLTAAITFIEVNGVAKHFDKPEDKAKLSGLLNGAPAITVDVLYMEYCKLVNDLIVLVETAVKKN